MSSGDRRTIFAFVDMITVVLVLLGLIAVAAVQSAGAKAWDPQEETASYWNGLAQKAIVDALRLRTNENVAKNIVFFLGDGMGVTTVTTARVLKGQKQGRSGEESVLEWEKFPHVALMKTYNVDRQVPDSAGTATAYLCGVKGNFMTLGVTAKTIPKNCTSSLGQEVSSILQWAADAGKDTGFVTTTRVTHASPAALYAHTAWRNWEADSQMPANATKCKDIALQLIDQLPGKNMKVIMGGGRGYFTPSEESDPLTGKKGLRADGRNLIKEWMRDKESRRSKAKYIIKNSEFDQWNPNETDYLLGLFDYSHMSYNLERDDSPEGQPSLAQMTTKAIQMLSKNPNGFFLFVEGGRIDHAHHDGYARLSLEDTLAMEDAVRAAVELTSEADTTIMVTADHSHVITFNGYPDRGSPIFGAGGESDIDNMTYTTLMYTNGPGYLHKGASRANLSGVDTSAERYQPQAAVPLIEETHGGEDVAAYVRGPMSHLFHGVQEQNYIAHALAYAACIGANKGHCKETYVIKISEDAHGHIGDQPIESQTERKSSPSNLGVGSVQTSSTIVVTVTLAICALTSLTQSVPLEV